MKSLAVDSNQFHSSQISEVQNIKGQVTWQSPSNIALIKYWGKYGVQLPKNPSLSLGLSEAYTTTRVQYIAKKEQVSRHKFLFEGQENILFEKKIFKFIDELDSVFPFLSQLDLIIESKNSFPHSAGIASSASSMSALALCLCSIEKEVVGSLTKLDDFYKKASYVSRLGSGSASRSIYGAYSIWGELAEYSGSSNVYAIPMNSGIHPIFSKLCDTILIVNDQEKKVSSRAGHALMNGHPYAEARLTQSHYNLDRLMKALVNGDKDLFVEVVENEAMSLHALMMSSKPWYSLLHPNTLIILDKIRSFREESGVFISFTLDAGPNVHLLYAEEDKQQVLAFIENELLIYCVDRKAIHDKLGCGPKKIV